ncbi:MAG: diadenylate cyclase CdaA [Chloroflexi bacterium]|nr:diadenylate cyclase CdaA [Chloroflexota bacterium]
MGELLLLLHQVSFLDIVDIAAVTLLIYLLLVVIQGTRADQILIGIAVLIVLSGLVQLLHLKVLGWLLQTALPALLVAIPIIFQPELRRLLEQLGRTSTIIQRPLTALTPHQTSNPLRTIDQLCEATIRLSERRYGGLIAIERETGLNDIIARGEQLDAQVNASLLLNLFFTNAPLHDGAVIIRGDRIVAAHCLFPLSDEVSDTESFGTRHRAALGISEVTDAVAIVISEESGTISIAMNGQLIRNLDEERLRSVLTAALLHGATTGSPTGLSGGTSSSTAREVRSRRWWPFTSRQRVKDHPADQGVT